MASYGSDPPPAKKSRGALVFSLVCFTVATGLGAYAYFLRTRGLEAEDQLEKTEKQLTTLRAQGVEKSHEIEELDRERTRLSSADAELRDTRAALAAAESRLHELEGERAEVDARLAEFRDVTDKFKKLIDAGTLDVTFRRGRMIVELPASVLFDSGSADLSDEGKNAVSEVAKVLGAVPQRRFVVGGHTDNVPAVKEYKSNWALSTARAVTVLEALIHSGIDPTRLSAAGYAEYDPIATNASAEGRKRNRRIEIVLEPYLTAIPGSDKGTSGPSAASGPNASPEAKRAKTP
jgi:chemotaxis protein MotB